MVPSFNQRSVAQATSSMLAVKVLIPLRNEAIEEHGSIDAYFKNTLGTKAWSTDIMFLPATPCSYGVEHLLWPGAGSAVLDMAGRNVPCQSFCVSTPDRSESFIHCLDVSLF